MPIESEEQAAPVSVTCSTIPFKPGPSYPPVDALVDETAGAKRGAAGQQLEQGAGAGGRDLAVGHPAALANGVKHHGAQRVAGRNVPPLVPPGGRGVGQEGLGEAGLVIARGDGGLSRWVDCAGGQRDCINQWISLWH